MTKLKGVGRLGLRLKVGKRRRQARFTHLDLDQEPRPAVFGSVLIAVLGHYPVFHHHKIHFAFVLVAQIAQLEVAKSKIRPAFDRLQQNGNPYRAYRKIVQTILRCSRKSSHIPTGAHFIGFSRRVPLEPRQ
jgi:hypothetical protein